MYGLFLGWLILTQLWPISGGKQNFTLPAAEPSGSQTAIDSTWQPETRGCSVSEERFARRARRIERFYRRYRQISVADNVTRCAER